MTNAIPSCRVCGERLSNERVEGLLVLETPPALWVCVKCSDVRPVKGVWSGEVGTSGLIVASGLGEYRINRN